MILHIINKSPLQHSALNDALPFINDDDLIILIDDGVYAAIINTPGINKIKALNCQCLALHDDVEMRGIQNIDTCVQTITMNDFVERVFNASKNISWY
jgi:tRNA 2-thiouridine synthesizing protein B